MNLQEVYRCQKKRSGFTLIEVLLVMALMLMTTTAVYVVGTSFYQSQSLNEVSQGLVSTLREAQMYSILGESGDSYGVRVEGGQYILFKGESFALREVSEDLIFNFSTTVSVSGLTEVVFQKLSGQPSVFGEVSLVSGQKERNFEILESGNISR